MKKPFSSMVTLLCLFFLFMNCSANSVTSIKTSRSEPEPEPEFSKSILPKVVSISSKPDQPNITIKDENGKLMHVGIMPTSIRMAEGSNYQKGKKYALIISKEGYKTCTVQVKNGNKGWYLGEKNFYEGEKGCLIVDPSNGNLWTLDKTFITELTDSPTRQHSKDALNIIALDDIPQDIRDNLISVN